MKKTKKESTRVDFRMPAELHDWLKSYAKRRNTTVTRIIVDHALDLKRKEEHVEQF